MKKMYKYTLYKTNGTKEEVISPKKSFSELYVMIGCDVIQLIPRVFCADKGRYTLYGDEEGRLKRDWVRNPHFKIVNDTLFGEDTFVVGNIVKEEVFHPA